MAQVQMNEMSFDEAYRAVICSYHAQRPSMLWGPPGVGKSALSLYAAEKLAASIPGLKDRTIVHLGDNNPKGFGFHDVRVSMCDPVDIGGLPKANDNYDAMNRLPPDWFPHTGRTDLPDYGILLLDEVSSAPPSTQAAAYQLTHDRRIGAYTMKKGWHVIMAGNRLTDGAVAFKMPTALANRCMHITVKTDKEVWAKWAIANGVLPEIVAAIRSSYVKLNTFEEHLKQSNGEQAFATERSWHIASDFMKQNESDGFKEKMIAGIIGGDQTNKFFEYLETWHKKPNIDDLIKNPSKGEIPKEAGIIFAVCAAMAAKVDETNFKNIVTYARRLPVQYNVLMVKDCLNRNKDLIKVDGGKVWTEYSKEFVQFLN